MLCLCNTIAFQTTTSRVERLVSASARTYVTKSDPNRLLRPNSVSSMLQPITQIQKNKIDLMQSFSALGQRLTRSNRYEIQKLVPAFRHDPAYQHFTIYNITVNNNFSLKRAYIFAIKCNRCVHIQELQAAHDFVQKRFWPLQAKASLNKGSYEAIMKNQQPFTVDHMPSEDNLDTNVGAIISEFLGQNSNRLLRIKVAFAPTECGIVIAVNSNMFDLASTKLIVQELLQEYSTRLDSPLSISNDTSPTPSVGSWDKLLPYSWLPKKIDVWNHERKFKRDMLAMAANILPITFRASQKPPYEYESNSRNKSSFKVDQIQLDKNVTSIIDNVVGSASNDIFSHLTTSILAATYRSVIHTKPSDGPTQFHVLMDLDMAHLYSVPLNTTVIAQTEVPHIIAFGDSYFVDKNIKKAASDLSHQISEAYEDGILSRNYYASSVLSSGLKTGQIPPPAYYFTNGGDISSLVAPEILENLQIDSIKIAATPVPNTCRIITHKFADMLHVSFIYEHGLIGSDVPQKVMHEVCELYKQEAESRPTESPLEGQPSRNEQESSL